MKEMNKQYTIVIFIIICNICNAQNFLNASVENWGNPNSCEINTPPDNWTDYSNGSGLGSDEANFSLCPTTIPPNASDGNVYARMYAGVGLTGEGMFQNVSGFVINNLYQITFDYAGSNLYSGTGDLQWHIFIDDADSNQTPVFGSAVTTWNTHTYYFTATAVTHKIGFRAYSTTTATGSGAIDKISLSQALAIDHTDSDRNISIYPNPVTDHLNIAVINNDFSEITLYDIASRKLLQQQFTNTVTLNTAQLAKGMYLYEVKNKKGVVKKGKVVKQ
jgi:type IX secretion system substrate protein